MGKPAVREPPVWNDRLLKRRQIAIRSVAGETSHRLSDRTRPFSRVAEHAFLRLGGVEKPFGAQGHIVDEQFFLGFLSARQPADDTAGPHFGFVRHQVVGRVGGVQLFADFAWGFSVRNGFAGETLIKIQRVATHAIAFKLDRSKIGALLVWLVAAGAFQRFRPVRSLKIGVEMHFMIQFDRAPVGQPILFAQADALHRTARTFTRQREGEFGMILGKRANLLSERKPALFRLKSAMAGDALGISNLSQNCGALVF